MNYIPLLPGSDILAQHPFFPLPFPAPLTQNIIAKEDGSTQGWRGKEEHKLLLLQQAAMKCPMLSQHSPVQTPFPEHRDTRSLPPFSKTSPSQCPPSPSLVQTINQCCFLSSGGSCGGGHISFPRICSPKLRTANPVQATFTVSLPEVLGLRQTAPSCRSQAPTPLVSDAAAMDPWSRCKFILWSHIETEQTALSKESTILH